MESVVNQSLKEIALLPMEDRSQFEGMVAFPASLEERNSLAEAEIKQLHSENKELKEDLEAIRASKSFRIGRAVTWLPRKARGGVKCYAEHGLRYTLRRFMEHLKGT